MNIAHPAHTAVTAAVRPARGGIAARAAAALIVAALLAAVSLPSWCITVRIKGAVKDTDGTPLQGVQLSLSGSKIKGKPITAVTKKKGTFVFMVDIGTYEILAEKDGYLPQAITVTTKDAGTTQVSVVLEAIATPKTVDAETVMEAVGGSLTGTAKKRLDEGIELLNAGDPKGAEAVFTELSSSNPEASEPKFYLGLTLAEQGNYAAAADQLRLAAAIDPAIGQTQFQLGKCLVELNEHDAALEAFEKAAAAEDLEAADIYQLAANLYIARDDFSRIAFYLNKVSELKPGDAEILYKLGSAWFNEGKMDEAITALEGAVAADPQMVPARYQLGLTYLNQGKTAEAVEQFRAVAEAVPNDPLGAEARNWVETLQ